MDFATRFAAKPTNLVDFTSSVTLDDLSLSTVSDNQPASAGRTGKDFFTLNEKYSSLHCGVYRIVI